MKLISENMPSKPQVLICPHCGNKSPQELLQRVLGPEEIISGDKEFPDMSLGTYYFLVKCASCDEVSLFGDWEGNDDLGDLETAKLLYPQSILDRIASDSPAEIVQDYREAQRVAKISPLAASVLFRRALEGICLQQKASGNNLKEKIVDLAKRGIIPEALSKMADAIRYVGNRGAHSGEENVDFDEVKLLDDFLGAILEYVYVAPAKLAKLSEKLKKTKK